MLTDFDSETSFQGRLITRPKHGYDRGDLAWPNLSTHKHTGSGLFLVHFSDLWRNSENETLEGSRTAFIEVVAAHGLKHYPF